MARPTLDAPHFHNEEAAIAFVERLLWPRGPVCPFAHKKTGVICASLPQRVGKLIGVRTKPSNKNPQGIVRHGLYKCYHCRGQFTVRKGTIFEETQLPMHLWLQVIHLMNSSKKGLATRQVQRLLNCSMETAWFLTHRVREVPYSRTAEMRKLLDAPISSYGSVQGAVYAWHQGAEPPFFTIRELSTGALVRANYKPALHGKVYDAHERPHAVVHIYGDIEWDRATNEIQSLEASDLEISEPLSDFDFQRLAGSAPRFTGTLTTDEYIEWVRGDGE